MDISKSSYTTAEKLVAVQMDKDATEEMKKAEDKKTIISNDAFAIVDLISSLINKIEHTRVSLL
jgi:hypothetical protein